MRLPGSPGPRCCPAAQPLSANTNAVATLDTPFANDPPTLADIEVLRAKVNELILALRR